jgi:hypothetical protein
MNTELNFGLEEHQMGSGSNGGSTSVTDDRLYQTWSAVFVNGNPKGSLMVRMSNVENQVENTAKNLEEIRKGVEALPGRLLLGLSILLALLALFQFLVPSIRKSLGMAQSDTPPTLSDNQHAINPAIY